MTSDQYTADVMRVAEVLLANDRWRAAVAGWSEETLDLSDLELELAVPGNSLSSAIAGQATVKLCFDAAILATEWVLTDSDPFDHAKSSELIDAHSDDVIFSELEFGSFLARYRLDPRTEMGRQRIFAILAAIGIALDYVAFLFPPATLPMLIVGTALAAPQILTDLLAPDPMSPTTLGGSEQSHESMPLHLDLSRLPPGTMVSITVPDDRASDSDRG